MPTFFNLADHPIDRYITPTAAHGLVEEILAGKPGLFPITGQAGTGKTTTLFMIAYRLWQQGHPMTVLSSDRALLEDAFLFPPEWKLQWVEPSEQAWLEAINLAVAHPEMALVIDQLTGDNDAAVKQATSAGHWVLTCIDTPFVGIDVLYNLRAWGFTTTEILTLVSGIVSQMLLPRLCEDCKQLVPATLEETRLIYPESQMAQELWREVGCPTCHGSGTGGRSRYGRCAIFEVLKIDPEIHPHLIQSLEHDRLLPLPAQKQFTLRDASRELVKQGRVGIQTYRREILQNPLLRFQHLWEQEKLRANRIQGLFGRFVTQQLIERLMSQPDFDRIIEGERRYVTCFFCDVRGFTTWAEHSSPHDIFWVLNRYFREIIDIVFHYEGTIDKFIGDAIMVVFGAPISQADQELRAVNCAIAIQQKVAEMNQHHPIPIQIGIGINSGEVVAGCLGSDLRMDYTILGDVVNTAARLESAAQAQQILLGKTTYQAVQGQVECHAIGRLIVKGKMDPLETFEVIY
ncbi:adenylate/guanylate cyclase domain-containing protein [Alkalinema sp. FACHB-956]|uniref:ATPase, T2SS/T4P/T4SS family n=1 Tax=Alkalinema sp. FACHB-956 TaxID=2692768 RepID=UPI0016871D6D|nr:adenylate/guanylate cyclase domain-containing protein [Alkalinema sp. FACHB-956]MBD2326325.1 hypothetical protein [Alkalinema sp. FACHB-956]